MKNPELSIKRKRIWEACQRSSGDQEIQICAVTKGRSPEQIQSLLTDLPDLKIIGENRYPDCKEAFESVTKKIKRHFIGPLQSNKIKKVLPMIDCLQSVDSKRLMDKIAEYPVEFLLQVNISKDPDKSGLDEEKVKPLIEHYLANKGKAKLRGFMTIGSQSTPASRQRYFANLRNLFDEINDEYFKRYPLPTLSMGMSDDYSLALIEGSTMVRLGSCLF